MNKSVSKTICAAPGIKWLIEADGVQVWNTHGDPYFIAYPEAAFWDLMVRDYSYAEIVEMLSYILLMEDKQVQTFLSETLRQWECEGLLLRSSLPNG